MWRRLRRRTMAPRRPAVYPEQWGLVLLVAIGTVAAIGFVLWMVLR